MTDTFLTPPELGRLARLLDSADTGRWREEDLRSLVRALGWTWGEDGEDGAVALQTGAPAPEAGPVPAPAAGSPLLLPLSRVPRGEKSGGYFSLHVPVAVFRGDGADRFAAAARTVTEALDRPPSVFGGGSDWADALCCAGEYAPYFVRWRRPESSLTLRPVCGGLELVLHETDWTEGHFTWATENGMPEGFLGDALVEENIGQYTPGGRIPDSDWDEWERSAGALLESVAAAAPALGHDFQLGMYGRLPRDSPMLFSIMAGRRFEMAIFPYAAERAELEAAGVGGLGWVSAAEEPAELEHDPEDPVPFHTRAVDAADVDGRAMARLLGASARALGVTGPDGLMPLDGSDDPVLVFSGRSLRYRLRLYGMPLSPTP